MRAGRAGLYFVAQLLGGLAGGGLLRLSVGEEHYRSGIGAASAAHAHSHTAVHAGLGSPVQQRADNTEPDA